MDDEILTSEEVAKYLRVSERTVYEWAQNSDMPCGKIGTIWRFKKSDIEKWINAKLAPKKPLEKPLEKIDMTRIVSPERIVFTNSSTKHDVLITLIDLLAKAPQVKDKQALHDAILNREALMSTALGHGIAVPHVRLDSVTDLLLAVAISKKDIIDFNSFDGKPVRLIFMMAAADNQHAYYLQVLSYFANRLRNEGLAEKLLKASSESEAYTLLTSE